MIDDEYQYGINNNAIKWQRKVASYGPRGPCFYLVVFVLWAFFVVINWDGEKMKNKFVELNLKMIKWQGRNETE